MSVESKIVVVGSCMIDFVSYVPRLPKPGETIHGTKFITNFGGKGANQCAAAAKLGAECALVARVGDDIWADRYMENLKSLKINHNFTKKTVNYSSGIAQIIVAESGENEIVIVAGSNRQLDENDVEIARNVVETARVVICQLETSVEVAIKTLQLAKGVSKVQTLINPIHVWLVKGSLISILNGPPGLSEYDVRLLTLPTIFCVNETEASMFTKLNVNTVQEAEIALQALLNKGCKSVIITLGANGALYGSQKEKSTFLVKCPVVRCVDTTGAGDAFLGALAYVMAYHEGLSMEKAIEFACTVATDSTTRPGTQISFPGPEIVKLL